jgi:transcriptional/translational regulatory protein YebC/TACO1
VSGHSKWAGIKHKKAVVDARRGQAFTRASREVTIAAREGGGDPEHNFRLRLAVQKAREVNMPADRIQAAIDRGTGAAKGDSLEELRYEGYGPAGVAILVDAVTDNRNRTAPAIRKGVISVRLAGKDPEEVGLAAIEAGADDIQVDADSVEITTDPASVEAVRGAVEALGVEIENAEVTMQPKQTVSVDEERAAAVLRLLEALEEEDDVQQVYANFDIPADVLERVSASV